MHKIKTFFDEHDLFARHSGIELLEVEPGMARARMKIAPYHFNGANTVHGGAIFTLADFVFAVASNSRGSMAMGINTSISFVKAALSGILYAEAEEQSRSAKLATYTVNVTDDNGELVALFQGMVYLKKVPIISKDAPQG